MRRVDRKPGERKLEVRRRDAIAQALAELDGRVEMIQALIPLGLKAVEEELQAAVAQLPGPRYQRGPADRRYYRWGRENGSVYLADQKVVVRVPRVRDAHAEREVRLPVYERLQEPRGGDAQLMGRVLRGLGCRNYQETAALVPEVFGLSASTVSRRFIRANAAKLQALMERELASHDLVALFLDGKSFGDDPRLLEKHVSPHTFRHTAAVHLVAAGVGVTVIQSWLGHAHLDTTFLYAQANVETKRRAIEQVDGTVRTTRPPRWKRDPALMAWLDSL